MEVWLEKNNIINWRIELIILRRVTYVDLRCNYLHLKVNMNIHILIKKKTFVINYSLNYHQGIYYNKIIIIMLLLL